MSGFSIWVRKCWPGVVPLVLLWAAAVWFTTVPVERNIGTAIGAALKDTVLDKTQVEVSGRDVRFTADAFSEEGRHSAVSQVEAVSGVRLVHDQTRLVPAAKPFVWTAERDVARVTLSGSAPLPAIRARLMDAARAIPMGSEAADHMVLSRGAPPRFDAAALLLIDQVGKLKEGKITLTDMAVSLAGMARELGSREAIVAALKNLPEGYTVADNAIAAPPYIFQANNDPVAQTLTLSGYVPDNNVHAAIIAAIGRKFVSEKVIDNLKASLGAPQGFANGVILALSALSRLSTGSLTVSDRDVKLSGDALYPLAAEQLQADLASGLPQGWKVKADISVKPVASPVDSTVCQQLFVEMLGKGKIRFESGRATIDPDSMGLLDRLVETALRCPTANLEIAGHTDSDGDSAANQTLSLRRAQAVVDYLIKAGLPKERVTAVGYGDSKPVAPNDTDENKAKNRRIEFVVR
ncbi:MAG: OmpA family protein [Bradyrhizobiaceae bacterium]|nr:MAG: OmpA family protein [Bradyrhizobiaceae bacterium]